MQTSNDGIANMMMYKIGRVSKERPKLLNLLQAIKISKAIPI
jgi:hypothetical protein